MIRLVTASFALLAVTVAFPGQAQISGVPTVTDGDTLWIPPAGRCSAAAPVTH